MRVRRVITTRSGGVSAAPYDSFNLGDHVGDDPKAVAANRIRLAEQIGVAPGSVVWMEQIHSRNVTVVDEPVSAAVPATDALVTSTPGLALAVLSADCVPVLLSDDEAGVIAGVSAYDPTGSGAAPSRSRRTSRPVVSHDVLATTDCGVPVTAAVRRGHVWGTQFHPEKSSRAGFRLLKNFIEGAVC